MDFEPYFDYGPRADYNASEIEEKYRNPGTRARALREIKELKEGWAGGEGSDGETLTRLLARGIIEADITTIPK